jgi:hypothetical protein
VPAKAGKKSKKSPQHRPKTPPKLSAAHWNSHAGFHAHEIRPVTLREIIDPHTPTKNLPELSLPELYDLAASRLNLLSDDFQVAIMGFGLIDKHRALAEVRARTELGKHLAILQMKMLQQLIRQAQEEVAAKRKS